MGRRRPSVFLGVFLREVDRNTFFFFFGAPTGWRCIATHCALRARRASTQGAQGKHLHGTPSSRLRQRARRGSTVVAVATSREVRRATSTKPPIPLAHALERGILHRKRGVARRRQRARVALRLRTIRHPHITTQESHTHGRVPDGVVGHVRRSDSSQPDLRAVVLREVDVSTSVPRSEQRREIHEQRAVSWSGQS